MDSVPFTLFRGKILPQGLGPGARVLLGSHKPRAKKNRHSKAFFIVLTIHKAISVDWSYASTSKAIIVKMIGVCSGNLLFCFLASIPPPSDDSTQTDCGGTTSLLF